MKSNEKPASLALREPTSEEPPADGMESRQITEVTLKGSITHRPGRSIISIDQSADGDSEFDKAKWYEWLIFSWVGTQMQTGSKLFNANKSMEYEDLLLLPRFGRAGTTSRMFYDKWRDEAKRPQPSLLRALRRAFGGRLYVAILFRFLSDGAAVAQPFILREFVTWLVEARLGIASNKNEGFIWAVALTLVQLFMLVCQSVTLHHSTIAFQNMASAVHIAIFEHTFEMEHSHGISGLISTLHGADASKFPEQVMTFPAMFTAVPMLIGGTIALYFYIGWAGPITVAMLILTVPIQGKIAAQMMLLRGACLKAADRRITAINEALQGIRICKFMGWEGRFLERIQDFRAKEMDALSHSFTYRSVLLCVMNCMPLIIIFVAFVVADALGETVSATNTFPALSMIQVLRSPLGFLPMAIGKTVDLMVSVVRLQAFLLRPVRDTYLKPHDPNDVDNAIVVANATVQYLNEQTKVREPLMKNLNVTVPRGKLTLVVGATGSGKSTLVNTIIGEALVSDDTFVSRGGSVAYMSQEAWIMNATVQDNILMGNPFDEERYIDALMACQLAADLNQLADGDQTEIGEKGINLSGGQKQRISFARSVYCNRDIVLMDDPLSAVDAHVCQALMDECVLGVLSEKTRVLVTHQTQFLREADHIIAVEDCAVVFSGTYEDYVKTEHYKKNNKDEEKSPSSKAKRASPTPGGEEPPTPWSQAKRMMMDGGAASPQIGGSGNKAQGKLMTKEGIAAGVVSGKTFAWYISRWGTPNIIMMAITFVVARTAHVFSELWLSWWSSRATVGNQRFSGNEYIMWFAVCTGVAVVVYCIRQVFFQRAMLQCSRRSHHDMIANVLRAPTSFFDTTPMGRMINRFSKDMEIMDYIYPEMLGFFLNLVFLTLGAIAVICYSVPYLSALFPFLAVMYWFLFRYYGRTGRSIKRLQGSARSPMMAIMNEVQGGLATIRAYDNRAAFQTAHRFRVDEAIRPLWAMRCTQRWLDFRVYALGCLVILSTGLLGTAMVSYDIGVEIGVAETSLSLVYAISMTVQLMFLTGMASEMESGLSSIERVQEYGSEVPQERDVVYGKNPGDPFPPPRAGWPTAGSVEFENVSLRYRDGLPLVLRDVSFSVRQGEKVGIVGRTGSGKSTIMLALFRIIELAGGRVSIDGMDIAKLSLADLRSTITIIPQDPLLFEGTIRSNIDPFAQRSNNEVWGALRKVGMYQRVFDAEGKLDCLVTEKGGNFSVGERQLLCLARALLKDCKVLLMDEATASVDFESDAFIQKTIREEFTHCTVLTIAHRLGTIIDADRVLVMDQGVAAEFDTPFSLLSDATSIFHGMVSSLGEEQFAQLMSATKRN